MRMQVILGNYWWKSDEKGIKSGPLWFVCSSIVGLQGAAEPLLFISLRAVFTSLLKAQESKWGGHKVLFVGAEEKQKAANSY